MRIAIASSGLGHVARGIETWALDTALAVSKLLSCQVAELPPVGREKMISCSVAQLLSESPSGRTLTPEQLNNTTTASRVSGATQHPNNTTTNHSVTLFAGAPLSESVNCHVVVIPCMRRNNWTTQQLCNWAPGWTWRWGWKSVYDIEQRSFWRHLWPILRDEKFDILHVQDPLLADLCRRYREAGKLKTKEILAHGTEESPEFLARFDYVQHLAPWHLNEVLKALRSVDSGQLTVDGKEFGGMRNG